MRNHSQPLSPPTFNGENYDSWSFKMRLYLISKGLWDLVENGYDNGDNSKAASSKDVEAKEMEKKDAEAFFMIMEAIPESMVLSLANAKTSKEAWTILNQKYRADKKNVPKRQHKECGGDIRDKINAAEEMEEESSGKAEKRRRITNPEDFSNVLQIKANVLQTLSRQSSGNQNVSRDIGDNTNAGEEGEASKPSSSSAITSTRSEFEVFLSFRGKDTRKGFTGHLYEGLQQRGVSTFKDDVNLDKGKEIDQLLEYIEKSKIFVPIFSENYADSKWCLKEVTKSVECGKEIVPVFFGVEPSDVQNKRGSFKSAFKKHESNKSQNQEEVNKWRKALKIVGKLSGFTLKEKNGDEVELKRAIIERVLKKVNKKPLQVAKHPIGIETRVEDVKRMLENIGGEGVGVIGIYGMGGLGKTTIAKAVYNELAQQFNGATCFLSDVRQNARQHNGLVVLQKQVFHQIFKDENINLPDVAHGASLIKERANKKKVLLILDDVDSVKQIDVLAGERDCFGSGSVIIITTRDKKVLLSHNVKEHEIYEPAVLNEEQSRKLFLQHAFNGKEPEEDYLQLSNKVITAAAGLPLTLEVLGSLLTCDMQIQEWKDTLEKLKKIPPEEVLQRLKLSYDRLEIFEQKIFLDISCFFIGRGRQNATYMWEDCGWFPNHSIKVLLERSLIKFDEKSREFWMHDQIRDMGRAIVEKESSEKQSRLWNMKDSLNLLQMKGMKDVEAIYLHYFMDPTFVADTKSFAGMSQLRLLLMHHMTLKGDYKHFPKELKCLQWDLYGLDSLPTSLPLKNIVVLDLSDSFIVRFWDVPKVSLNQRSSPWSRDSKSKEMPILRKLRVLKLKGCRSLTMCPDFRSMPNLQILDCEGCKKMSELHQSIKHLQSLINLNLESCSSLKELPKEIWQLTSLEELNLEKCSEITALPSPIGDCMSSKQSMLEKLRVLKLKCCTSLTMCPDFRSMPNLQILDCKGCKKMSELHLSIRHLQSLINLNLEGCSSLKELPKEVWQLTSLEELNLEGCYEIIALPSPIGDCMSSKQSMLEKLRVLKLSYCKSLTVCPDFRSMPNLQILDCLGCSNMSELHPSIGHLQSLMNLNLSWCDSLKELPKEVGQLTSLEELNLERCSEITTLPSPIGDCMSSKQSMLEKLRVLKLRYCESLTVCPDFSSMPNLQILDCQGCKKMRKLHPSIGHLRSLINLNLSWCSSLKELPKEAWQLTLLEELNLGYCSKITALPSPIGDCMSSKQLMLEKIKFLNLKHCRSLITCPNFMSMPHLEKLKLQGCGKIKEVDPSINYLKSVIELDLSYCKTLKELPQEIEQLKQLKSLDLSSCSSLQSLPPLPPSLISLNAFYCVQLESIADVSNVKGLQQLNLFGCERLVDIPGIEQLKCLQILYLSKCRSLCDSILGRIKCLDRLTELDLRGCVQMTEIDPSISQLTSLESLNLRGCCQITALPQLPPKLTTLKAAFCIELERIEDVSFPEGLKELDLTGCRKLVDIPGIVQFKGLRNLKLGLCRSLEDSFLERVEQSISHLDWHYLKSYSIPGRVIKGGSSDLQSFSFHIPEWLLYKNKYNYYLVLEVDESSFKRICSEVEQSSNVSELEDESMGSSEEDRNLGLELADERSKGSELEDERKGSSEEDRNLGLELADERSNIPNDDEVGSPIESQQGRSIVRLLFSTADDAQISFSTFFEDWDPKIWDKHIPTATVKVRCGDLEIDGDEAIIPTATVRRGEVSSPSKMIKMHVSIDGCLLHHADLFTHFVDDDDDDSYKYYVIKDYVCDHNIVMVKIR